MSPQTTRPTIDHSTPTVQASAGPQLPAPTIVEPTAIPGPSGRDQTSPQARTATAPISNSPAGTKIGRGHNVPDSQRSRASATNYPGNQECVATQTPHVAGDQTQPTVTTSSTPRRETLSAGQQGPPAPIPAAAPRVPPSLADPFLSLAADVLDDLEKVRIANENRFRQLTRTEADADGEERGFGLTEDHPDVARLAVLVDGLTKAEHQATLNLQRLLRKHPLGPWVKAMAGIGEKQGARLLAVIGDPYMRPELLREDGTVDPARPRTVSELWAYCGYHVLPARHMSVDAHSVVAGGSKTGHPEQSCTDPRGGHVGVAPKRQKGQRANWSTVAKTRTYLIAESCIKQRTSPFRPVYDDTRVKYADAVHAVECVRCGPKGKPAPASSPLSDGHQHARAMRAVSKAVLKELWRESKRLHEGGAS